MAEAKMREIEAKRELAMLDYANKHQISLENVKAMLAKTAMTLAAQKQLAGVKGKAPQVAQPAVEPPGRAPNGQRFQK
jgi:uncharacterized protein YdbL (DUF1318 family)